jgi:hypothetical protein
MPLTKRDRRNTLHDREKERDKEIEREGGNTTAQI